MHLMATLQVELLIPAGVVAVQVPIAHKIGMDIFLDQVVLVLLL